MKREYIIFLGIAVVIVLILIFRKKIFMFEQMMVKILKHEGGYVNDPDDPGGETKYGISKRAFPNLDIKNLTLADAYRIYKEKYYVPMGIEKIKPDSLAMQVFDFGVNAGVARSLSTLKKANEINYETGTSVLNAFITLRTDFYIDIATGKKAKFLAGWLNRVKDSNYV
jgi:hypothetical protein